MLTEIGPSHPATYREDIITPIVKRIIAGGSCAIVGAASMGKSRLLQHLLRPEIQEYFLGDEVESTLLVWVDCNRLSEISPWGLYELMLTGIVEAVDPRLREPYEKMRDEAIIGQNGLVAQRKLELALRLLCQEEAMRVFFILDEFDDTYCHLDEPVFGALRSLRDMNKYQLGYILFMRDRAELLREPIGAIEGFYELFSRNVIGLTPYSHDDSTRVVTQIAARLAHEFSFLPRNYTQHIVDLSGGHPGLIVALMSHLVNEAPTRKNWSTWAVENPNVTEECRKIWDGLRKEERQILSHIAQDVSTSFKDRESLLLKGLIRVEEKNDIEIFSPLFANYVRGAAIGATKGLRVDSAAGTVLIDEQPITNSLTHQEFKLVNYLYEHSNQIRSVNEIIEFLYPGAESFRVSGNSIAALVGRIRKKIEPNAKKPQYLTNIKGMGYKLNDQPE